MKKDNAIIQHYKYVHIAVYIISLKRWSFANLTQRAMFMLIILVSAAAWPKVLVPLDTEF